MLTRQLIRTMATKISGGPVELAILEKLQKELNPVYLDVKNDSWKHASHHGMQGAENRTESHFRIEIVSDAFQGKNQPARHRLIYSLLKEEIEEKGVHALQMKTRTPAEVNK